jgi:MATE family multidrug resistance protein
MLKLRELKQEFKPMLGLAGPVVAAELGWSFMGMVDTLMVGRVSAEAIGAVSLGTALYLAVAIFGIGLLLGLDTMVSQAFGAGKIEDCHRSLLHGTYLSLLLTVVLTGVIWSAIPFLPSWGLNPEVLPLTVPYLEAITWSTLPLLLYATFRRYLQAMGLVKPVMVVLVTANLVNVVANWILVFGNLGAPAVGVGGAGCAPCSSRAYLAAGLVGYALYYDHRHQTGLRHTRLGLEMPRVRRLLGLGFPAAIQITLELGAFALATTLAGKLDAASLAAHQIALTAASFMFMVPLGVSSAGAVRVGQALGRRDPAAAARAGWTALVLGTGFMGCGAIAFQVFPSFILRAFTADEAVVSIGVSLLFVAAYFQLFDGIQVVATGVLRGTGDTRTPMVTNLVGHWFLGLPIGYALGFVWGWGVIGLWVGLSIGLIVVGLILLVVWSRRVRSIHRELALSFG